MEEKTVTKEIKVKVANRLPPGDRWVPLDNNTVVLDSLMDLLEFIYQAHGNTQFYIDAKEGAVYIINTEETIVKPVPKKTYSLYGED